MTDHDEMATEHLTGSFVRASKRAAGLLAYGMPFDKVCEELATGLSREMAYLAAIAGKIDLAFQQEERSKRDDE